jgi:hypothetical protein
MRAIKATITVLLDPRVIGPEAESEWTTESNASDYISSLLTESERHTVLDWAYVSQAALSMEPWREVEIGDPDKYEEGSHV